ncbi:hypothetical protein E2C01_032102 [Portunus trituberculatus]|uniref:Uncharacterized protein n=1 Tax=Portunus trituberculatus TaxID=210409 RepID=A0A5B7F0G7_PORTR|nr:hypothetical protein [Portunus trituberculatus]
MFSKTQLTEIEHEELKAEVEELKLQKSKLKAELAKESQKHNIKLESLNQQLTEKTEEAKKLTVKASDLENEVQVLNRKHNNALKVSHSWFMCNFVIDFLHEFFHDESLQF